MNRTNRNRPKLKLRLKIHKKDGEVVTFNKQVLRTFTKLCRACPSGERYDLRVIYYPHIKNEGVYETKKDMLFALNCFTNSRELDFIEDYWDGGKIKPLKS